jgi:hypothetical protein
MSDLEPGLFTVGVFQDVAWAENGLKALSQAGFVPQSLTVLAKESAEVAALFARTFGTDADRLELPAIGAVLTHGALVDALQGPSRDLLKLGLSGTMRRVGFQSHDARIFEVLAARGGVLVAIRSEPRAADALAILHSYGGGNAAIGAWTGRL